jgi:hypothetical protein
MSPTAKAEERRTTRTCQGCRKSDDHPHHVQAVFARHPVTDAELDLSVSRHIDCCAAAGCEVCSTHLEFTQGKKGAELVAHMQALPKAHARALFERHGIESPGFEFSPDSPPPAADAEEA